MVTSRLICSVTGCENPHYARSWCSGHYERWRHGKVVEVPLRVVAPRGTPRFCEIEDCGRRHYARGYCNKHYQRWESHGDPRVTKYGPYGEGVIHDGYRLVHIDGRYIGEHRLIMERLLGRPLLPDETVHHVNGVRTDNRSENLELWSSKHPKGQRVEDLVAWAKETLMRYEPEALVGAKFHGRSEVVKLVTM
jgi:HNH endonuclease